MKMQRNSEEKYVLIFNATTLIVLRELQFRELIGRIREQNIAKVIIPESVKREFLKAGERIDIISNDIPLNHTVTDSIDLTIPRSLGDGEKQAIAIAYMLTRSGSESTVVVVTDERKARSVCKKIGVKVLGTLGLIEFSKKHGILTKEEALSLLDMIPMTSLYIKPELLEEACTRIRQQ